MNILKNNYYDFYEYIHNLSHLNVPETYIIGVILSTIVTILYILLNRKSKIVNVPRKFSIFSNDNRPRFRKRDKIVFYGRKVLRSVRGTINTSEKQRKIYRILSRGILNRKNKDSPSTNYYRNEPNQYLLDFESSLLEKAENYNHQLPSALINLIRSVKVFGYFDQKIIIEICKYMETKIIYAGNYLFKIGDPDDSIYVVESGKVNVFITDEKGQKHLIKQCVEGDHVFSLLSIMDILTNTMHPYRTVSAKAIEDTSILRLPGKAFVEVLHKYPESLVRITQIIMVRLQRVTFTALHNYLGLTSEIIKMDKKKERKLSSSSKTYYQQRHPKSRIQQTSFFIDSSEADPKNKRSLETASSSSSIIPESNQQRHDDSHSSKSTRRKSILSSSDEDNFPSNRSEFGESSNNNELYQELGLIEANIAKLFHLDDVSVLKDRITLMSVSEGTILNREGDHQTCQLIYVVRGLFGASQHDLSGESSFIFHIYPGEIGGSLSVLTGEPSQFTFVSKQDSDIALISKEHFYQIIALKPSVVLPIAHTIVKRMSSFVRQIDFALEWNLIESGATLFRQNQKSDNIYIVLNGRLRSILSPSNSAPKQLVGEYGRGDLVGLVEVLMEANNATTVMAIRDTEVTQIPTGLLNFIKYRHPRVVTRLIQLLSSRLLGNLQNNVTPTPYIDTNIQLTQPIDAPTVVSNLCTVAVLPVSDDVPLDAFTIELKHALSDIDSTLLLTKDYIIQNLGKTALERVNEYRLLAWLGQQEDHHRVVLYQCEHRLTPWTKRCLRQADCLLIIGLADKSPTIGQLEKEIENFAIRAQKELVILHRMDGPRPRNTVNWLKNRGWCTSYHHVRCPKHFFSVNENNLFAYYNALKLQPVDKHSGFSRLARFLTGTSVGLILGGGGARGSSHVGVIKALREANIPIDMIGGTSIGSFIGALYADELDYDKMDERAKKWCNRMTSYASQVLDLTYPFTSMFSGYAFNKTIEDAFGDRQIEDLWIPYFCITTDISASKMRIHTSGCVWRYVRASMSLSGYFAPICDPVDGHLLLDGGYVNNLPADVMHRMGINIVLAVDVGSRDDVNYTNYGDTLSGWWLLWKKWNHWASPVKVPDLTEIQTRLAYVSCHRQLEKVKNSIYCEYLRPPIDKYRTIQFGSYEEIRNVGYDYAKMIFDLWTKHNGSCQQYLEKRNTELCSKLGRAQFKDKSSKINNESQGPIRLTHIISSVYDTQTDQSLKFDDLSELVHQKNDFQSKIPDRKQSKGTYTQEIHSFSCGDEILDNEYDSYSSSEESSGDGILSEPNIDAGYTSTDLELAKMNSQTDRQTD